MENLTSIGGELKIGGYWPFGNNSLQNLTGLNNLTNIGGALNISDNPLLQSLTGLESLTSIDGDLVLGNCYAKSERTDSWSYGNASLKNLAGLNNLNSLGGRISIHCNDSLNSLTGLEKLDSIEGLILSGNPSLHSLQGLDNLTFIGEEGIEFYSTSLNNITSLENLNYLGGNLSILFNHSLSTCDMTSICNYLNNQNGTIEIGYNAPGCNSQEEVEEACESSCLPEGITFTKQAEIDSFQINHPDCTVIQGDVIISGEDITDLSGLIILTSIRGKLAIKNTALTSLTGLENLTLIAGSLGFGDIFFGEQNPLLTSLTGLENLTTIGGNLDINGSAVTNYTGLNNLISIGGNFGLGGWLITLSDLNGLENLTTIGGNLGISLDTLTSLSGLDNLISIGGDLKIFGNSSLTSLTGLDNVTSIGGELWIYHNALTSLTGLGNIDANSIENITISFNHSLALCEVQSICNYLVSPNGTVEIHNNAPGCNSQAEVEDACASSINEVGTIVGLTTSPNPFTTSTAIEYGLTKPSTVQITIYNHLGKQVEVIKKNQSHGKQQITWNAKSLPAGVYYCVLKTENGTQTMKMIKLK